jgi:hypothetical protein
LGKARAHVRRDRERGNIHVTIDEYKSAIHKAVVDGNGMDVYTGLPLRWDLLHTYNNIEAKAGGRAYKSGFADLPTVDHIDDGMGSVNIVVCSWRVNACKSDLTLEEFLAVCRSVQEYHSSRNLD